MNRRLALIPYLVLVAFVAAGLLWYLGDLRSHNAVESVSTGEVVTLGGPFALTDQNNMLRTEKDFAGKYTLVFFGYTYCPDVCPATLAVMAAALDRLGPRADRIVPLFITVDPKRDTPEKMKSYLASFGTRFVGLTGTADDIAKVAKEYRVYYREHPAENGGEYTVDHSGVVYLMDPNGKFIANYSLDTSPDMLAADLAKRLH
ncbi:MAG TPA: SCO family protein [Micropepsaceae bacterium]|nr:SCO family protein [Micropepsaceae bacterium]